MAQDKFELFSFQMKSDEEAFRMIFERYYSDLCVVAFLYTNDKDEAEDLVQQLFIRIWERKLYRNISISFRAYLHTAVTNSCLNYLEKRKKNQERLAQLPQPDATAEVFDFLLDAEEKKIFEKVLAEIPAQSRIAIELVYFFGKSYQIAAKTMNISVNTIKTHLKSGLRHIKKSPALNQYFSEKKT